MPSLGSLGTSWLASAGTAIAVGFGSSFFGSPDITIKSHGHDYKIPIDLGLGVGLGLAGLYMRKPFLQTASAFLVGTAAGRLSHAWFHGPAITQAHPADLAAAAAAKGALPPPGAGVHPGLHGHPAKAGYGYGFGADADPLVAAAKYL